jgi:transcriptional regulator
MTFSERALKVLIFGNKGLKKISPSKVLDNTRKNININLATKIVCESD